MLDEAEAYIVQWQQKHASELSGKVNKKSPICKLNPIIDRVFIVGGHLEESQLTYSTMILSSKYDVSTLILRNVL